MFTWQLLSNQVWQCMHFAQTNVFCKQPSSTKIVFPILTPHIFIPLLGEKLDNLSGNFENSIYRIFILQALREVSSLLSRIFKYNNLYVDISNPIGRRSTNFSFSCQLEGRKCMGIFSKTYMSVFRSLDAYTIFLSIDG
jgi:hypothetical protein